MNHNIIRKSILRGCAVCLLGAGILMTGCGKRTDTPQSDAAQADSAQSDGAAAGFAQSDGAADSSQSGGAAAGFAQSDAEVRVITLSVINLCGADIGMFSVIDPVTGEQINLDSLADGETLSLEASWPEDATELQWAVYNLEGELYMEGSTDITSAEASATLLLMGDGGIDSVEALFQ